MPGEKATKDLQGRLHNDEKWVFRQRESARGKFPLCGVCERRRAVPGRAVPRAHDRRVGRWRGRVRNGKSWVLRTLN